MDCNSMLRVVSKVTFAKLSRNVAFEPSVSLQRNAFCSRRGCCPVRVLLLCVLSCGGGGGQHGACTLSTPLPVPTAPTTYHHLAYHNNNQEMWTQTNFAPPNQDHANAAFSPLTPHHQLPSQFPHHHHQLTSFGYLHHPHQHHHHQQHNQSHGAHANHAHHETHFEQEIHSITQPATAAEYHSSFQHQS